MFRTCLAAAVMLCGAATPSSAFENFTFYHSPHRVGPWIGPACEAPEVLRRIARQFDQAEAAYWHTGVRMAHVAYPRETGYRHWDPPIIATRYCSAEAYLTDGARHELVYWLRSEQGFAGVGWGVTFCLTGRDRDYSFAPHCRQLRPLDGAIHPPIVSKSPPAAWPTK